MWIRLKWKTWYLSLGGSRGTHCCVRQRSVHVHVTCSKRPTLSRRTVGERVVLYGSKRVVTRRRAGSTHFESAPIARRAVISAANRWRGREADAYALDARPD